MREIKTHQVVGDPAPQLTLIARGELSHGGAFHEYAILVPAFPDNNIVIQFQKGPIGEFGCNGLSHEVLLAVVIDRLRCFQAGEYACRDNALALTKLEEGLMWLQRRTLDRIARGVEGENAQ